MMQVSNRENPMLTGEELFEKGKSFDEIQKHLRDANYEQAEVMEVINSLKARRNEKHRRIGVPLIAVGVGLCVTGFFAVIIAAHSGSDFSFALYGMTSLGATSIMGGLFTLLG